MCPDYVKREFFIRKNKSIKKINKEKLNFSKNMKKNLLDIHLFWNINTPCIFERSTTPNINKG